MTSIREIIYIICIKDFFKWSNIRKSYEKQILNYNVDKFSLIVKANFNIFSHNRILTWAN